MFSNKFLFYILPVFLLVFNFNARGNPEPGDVFKELVWVANGGCAGAVRIASDACAATYFPGQNSANQNFTFPGTISKDGAIKAEVSIQKVMCHDGTTGFELQMNNSGNWHALGYGEGSTIPNDSYQYMIYPSIEIPLDEIAEGENVIKFRVSASSGWCPQNLVYGGTLRVYYPAGSVEHPTGAISCGSGAVIGMSAELSADVTGNVDRVDFIYKGLGVNWEGEGNYTQWHYHFFKGDIMHHIGSATSSPWNVTWNTEWVPTQPEGKLEVCARLVGSNGMVCMTDAIALFLQRTGHSVEIGQPYNVPAAWVTRSGAKSENFDLSGNTGNAKAARVCWSSWGDHCGGGNVNGTKFGCGSDVGGYNPRFHEAELDAGAVRNGQNTLTIDWGGHHGMEVNWPGPMVLVQYSDSDPKVSVGIEADKTKAVVFTDRLAVTKTANGAALKVAVLQQGAHTIQIFSSNGTLLARRDGASAMTHEIELGQHASGMYLVRCTIGDAACGTRLVAVGK